VSISIDTDPIGLQIFGVTPVETGKVSRSPYQAANGEFLSTIANTAATNKISPAVDSSLKNSQKLAKGVLF